MRRIFLVLILTLSCISTQAQSQLPIVSAVDYPIGYKASAGASKELILREDLVIEREDRSLKNNLTTILVMTRKINSDAVFVVIIQTNSRMRWIESSAYWQTKGGYIKLTRNILPDNHSVLEKSSLEKQADEAWQIWEKYIREKYNINDKEMEELDRFLEL